jgi:hypothetical protein
MYKHTVNVTSKTMWLVLSEWQGVGVSNLPAEGARALTRHLFEGRNAVTIDVPDDAELAVMTACSVWERWRVIAGASVVEFCDREPGDANRVARAGSTTFQ